MSDLHRVSQDLPSVGPEPEEPPEDDSQWLDEHYIPLRKADLVRRLADDTQLSGEQRTRFLQLCTLINATFHHQYHELLETLKDLYAPFDPDSVTKDLHPATREQRDELVPRLFERFAYLLQRANYRRLTEEEIKEAAGAASDWGVRLTVNFRLFDRLEVHACGDVTARRTRRHWRRLYRLEEVDVPLYQRLVVMFRVRDSARKDTSVDSDFVHIKLFKNIPKQDVDMLLPGARFHMTLLDRGKILLPTLSGIAITVAKILKGAVLSLLFAGFYGILAFLGIVGGAIGYGIRSFTGYLRTKDKYHLYLTRSLYYQNLDNNAGVLHRLLDEAEEQESREAVLAYALLRTKAGSAGWTLEQLDREAEAYLAGVLGFALDFEVHDAIHKLVRLGCVEAIGDDRWRAVPLDEALVRIDHAWDDCFRHSVHDPDAVSSPQVPRFSWQTWRSGREGEGSCRAARRASPEEHP